MRLAGLSPRPVLVFTQNSSSEGIEIKSNIVAMVAKRAPRQRAYLVAVPVGCGFEAVVVEVAVGLSQQALTRAVRLSVALGSMVPCRTTHLNVA